MGAEEAALLQLPEKKGQAVDWTTPVTSFISGNFSDREAEDAADDALPPVREPLLVCHPLGAAR